MFEIYIYIIPITVVITTLVWNKMKSHNTRLDHISKEYELFKSYQLNINKNIVDIKEDINCIFKEIDKHNKMYNSFYEKEYVEYSYYHNAIFSIKDQLYIIEEQLKMFNQKGDICNTPALPASSANRAARAAQDLLRAKKNVK